MIKFNFLGKFNGISYGMDSKKLSKILVYLILFIFIIHFVATKLYWYSLIWWFDMFVHFIGGFWIALMSLYFFPSEYATSRSVLKILMCVLVVGIGWEVFEIFVNDIIAQNLFDYADTLSDVVLDLSGGALAILFFFKRIMLQSK